MASKESEEIVILGAGLAGLTLAYRFSEMGVPYRLLEARDRIGGRIKTISTNAGATIEMGATWFADKHIHLMQLIKQLDVPYQQQYTGSRVLYDHANPERNAQLFELPATNESQYLFKKGTNSLIEALYQQLDQERILLGHQVNSLEFDDHGININAGDQRINAHKVVNTLPPNLFLNTMEVTPGLPKALAEVSSKAHTWMGESIKVGLEYPDDFWREHKIGTIMSQFGPAQELHDHQHDTVKGNVLKGFVSPDFHHQGHDYRKARVIEQMAFYFGKDLPHAHYYEKDWQDDPLTYYPYTSEVIPHQNNGHSIFRESFFDNRLYFAGSETAQAFPGYLDGAVERAFSLSEILTEKKNTKNEIHEEKA